jgi:D-aminopeptidase
MKTLVQVLLFLIVSLSIYGQTQPPRARDLGIPFEGTPGPFNAITDVKGVLVGFKTLIQGEGKLVVGKGPVRTGVTVILPKGFSNDSVPAGYFVLNGDGEMTGLASIEEYGENFGAIGITNTNSVGVVRDAIGAWNVKKYSTGDSSDFAFGLPVVAETFDGGLNDIDGLHVSKEDVWEALDTATSGPVKEGNVGGGTGMRLFHFKGGTGTASRLVKTVIAPTRSGCWCRPISAAAKTYLSPASPWAERSATWSRFIIKPRTVRLLRSSRPTLPCYPHN